MTNETTSGISRRTLAKGAAWAVPAVAVAAATPVMAQSGTVTFTNLSQACKLPGASCEGQTGVKKGYVVAMTVCNNVTGTPGNVTVTFPATLTGLLCGASKTWNIAPNPLVLTQTGCKTVYISLDGEPDSANCTISGSTTFTWAAANGLTGSGDLAFSAPATPPCDKCKPPTVTTKTTTAGQTTSTTSTTQAPTTTTTTSTTAQPAGQTQTGEGSEVLESQEKSAPAESTEPVQG